MADVFTYVEVVTCGVALSSEDLQRLSEHDLLNDKVQFVRCIEFISHILYIDCKGLFEAGSTHCSSA